MAKDNRYVVTFEAYVYAENDYMARKIAHGVKRECSGYESKVIEIVEAPFGSLNTRKLENISDITYEKEQEDLPF